MDYKYEYINIAAFSFLMQFLNTAIALGLFSTLRVAPYPKISNII